VSGSGDAKDFELAIMASRQAVDGLAMVTTDDQQVLGKWGDR